MQGINVEDVKKYNDSLRAQQEKAANIKAEIEFNNKEFARGCEDLTRELGIQVTPENLEQIYNDRVAKINSTLQTGKEILARIAEEEASMNTPAVTASEPSANVSTSANAGQVFAQAPSTNVPPVVPPVFASNPNNQFSNAPFASLDGGKESFGNNNGGSIMI